MVWEGRQLVSRRERRYEGQITWVQILASMSCGLRPSPCLSLNLGLFICRMKMVLVG